MNSPRQSPVSEDRVFTSKIVEWDHQKGFGFLLHQKGKLFLHYKDFAERHKRPSKGDRIHYRVGSDPKGRRCAVQATHVNDGGKIRISTWFGLMALALIPAVAVNNLILDRKIPPLYIILPLLIINVITYITYKADKEKARAKIWRTPESTLHFLALIGGWPAALIAQRQLRHKCSKTDFQFIYWMTVLFHIYLAIDYIFEWQMLKAFIDLLKQLPS